MRLCSILASAKSILVIGLAYSSPTPYNFRLTAPRFKVIRAPLKSTSGSLMGIYDCAFCCYSL